MADTLTLPATCPRAGLEPGGGAVAIRARTVAVAAPGPGDGPVRERTLTDSLGPVRWAALLFLAVDATDALVGAVAPEAVGAAADAADAVDVAHAAVGLLACGLLLWQRWAWAVAATAALLLMAVVREPGGAEFQVMVVGAAVAGATLAPRRIWWSLLGSAVLAAAIGMSPTATESGRWRAMVLSLLIAVVATALGMVGRRLWLEREAGRLALASQAEANLRIRTEQRQLLAAELRDTLSESFTAMRAETTASGAATPATPEPGYADVAGLRRTLALLGEQSRSTLASLRVSLLTLRADLEAEGASPGPPAWIESLWSVRSRVVTAVVFLALTVPAVWTTDGVVNLLVAVLAPLSVAVAMARPQVGLVLAVVALGLGLVTPAPVMWLAAPAVLSAYLSSRSGRPGRVSLTIVLFLVLVTVSLVRHGQAAAGLVAALEVAAVLGVLAGLTVGHFEAARRRWAERVDQLRADRERVATADRAAVARELHDAVGHQLSLVSLQALGAEGEVDATALLTRLERARDALATGESEISVIVGALDSMTDDEVPHGRAERPSAMVERISRQLEGHDFHPAFDVDPRLDDLEPTTRTTVSRILQECSTNVVRHASVGTPCTFTAALEDGVVALVVRSALAEHPTEADPQRGGHGLRGIRERVDLTGGTLAVGSDAGVWEVRVRLPAPAGG